MTKKKAPPHRAKPAPAADVARRAKVAALAKAVREGRYETDASALADRLIAAGVLSSTADPEEEPPT